jgi:hypothetical protein
MGCFEFGCGPGNHAARETGGKSQEAREVPGFGSIHIGVYVFLSGRALRRVPEAERTELGRAVFMLILALLAAVFVLQVLSALGLVYAGSSAPVLVALVGLLAFSGFQFVRLLRMFGGRPDQ